ncbi:MAG: RNA polymerase sigma factor [Chloroflexota bacterium]
MDDTVAIQRLQHRDIGGLDELMLRYQLRAIRAAYLVCRDPSMAEDIVQTAFLRAYERIDQFDSSRPFGPWFLRSVVNDAIQATVREQRTIPLDTDIQIQIVGSSTHWKSTGANVVEQIERLETGAEIRAAIAQLPVKQRAAIVLRYYLDLTDDEISARLNSTPSTVRWRLHAARMRLRSLVPEWLRPAKQLSVELTDTESNPVYLTTEQETEKKEGLPL